MTKERTNKHTETHACDLIDRQAAINAVKHAWAKGLEPTQYLEDLLSVQPDVPDTNVGDMISRQAAIDAMLAVTGHSSVRELYEHVQEHGLSDMWSGGVSAAIDIIIAVPSAQTTQNNRVNSNNALDTISREAAIEALSTSHGILYPIRTIESLPSAQPDLSEYSNRLWRSAYERGKRDAQPEQQWIPCSERLPEESGRYLISVLDGVGRRTTVAPYQPRCKAWTMTGRMAYWKVIAWMPLPEPYGGE